MNNAFVDFFDIIRNQFFHLSSEVEFWLSLALILFLLSIIKPMLSWFSNSADEYIASIKNSHQKMDIIFAETKAKIDSLNDLIDNFEEENKLMLEYVQNNIDQELKLYSNELNLIVKKYEKDNHNIIINMIRDNIILLNYFTINNAILASSNLIKHNFNELDHNNFIEQNINDCIKIFKSNI